jgi:hypothetical protein
MRLVRTLSPALLAGAALALSACGTAEEPAAENQAATGLDTDPMFDGNVGNDVTAIDATGGGAGNEPTIGGAPNAQMGTEPGTGVGTTPAANATQGDEGNTVGM